MGSLRFLLLVTFADSVLSDIKLYWNCPSRKCLSKWGVDLNLGSLGILHNANQEFNPKASGDKVAMFYAKDMGLYNGTATCYIPQCTDLTAHITKATNDINTKIPHTDFDGVAVIDWEHWRFTYDANWHHGKKYWKASWKYVRDNTPNPPTGQALKDEAERQFNEAARNMILQTLQNAKTMRPNAKWGFYIYPECYGPHRGCQTNYDKDIPTQEQFLYDASTALFPSVYFKPQHKNKPSAWRRNFINAKMQLAKEARTGRNALLYPYVKITYDEFANNLDFLSPEDLCNQLAVPISYGADGLVFWTSSASMNSAAKCTSYQTWMQNTLKPFLDDLVARANACSDDDRHSGSCFTVTCGASGAVYS